MAFDPKTTSETRLLSFNFADKAPDGVTLTTPVITVAKLSGSGDASDLTIASETVVSQTVTCLASVGIDGATYRLKAVATGSNGEVYEIQKDLFISDLVSVV